MREDQVLSTGVNIEGLAELFHAHGRALDVPTGAAFTPGCIPDSAHAAVFFACGLPECEVARIFFPVFVGINSAASGEARAGTYILELDARELTVLRER